MKRILSVAAVSLALGCFDRNPSQLPRQLPPLSELLVTTGSLSYFKEMSVYDLSDLFPVNFFYVSSSKKPVSSHMEINDVSLPVDIMHYDHFYSIRTFIMPSIVKKIDGQDTLKFSVQFEDGTNDSGKTRIFYQKSSF